MMRHRLLIHEIAWALLGILIGFIDIGARASAAEPPAKQDPNMAPATIQQAPEWRRPEAPENFFVGERPQQQSVQAQESMAAPAGAVVYVDNATIDSVSPSVLLPNKPMMVTLTVQLATPIPQSELIPALRVFVDSVEAEPQEFKLEAAASQGSRDTGPTSVGITAPAIEPAKRDTVGVTLFVIAPEPLEGGRDLTLSVYSTLDRREIASKTVTAAPNTALGASLLANPAGQALLGGVFLLAAGAVGLILRQRRVAREQIRKLESVVQVERRRVSELGRGSVATDGRESAKEKQASAPELPAEVMAALERGELVLVLGPGASAQSGLPTSRSLWLNILDRHAASISPAQRDDLRTLITREGADAAIEPIMSLVGRDGVLMALREELADGGAQPSRFHELLAELPVPVVLDMNWDDLMARALTGRAVQTFGPSRQDGISEALRAGQLALLKPFGDLRQPESVVLTEREYRRVLAQAPELERSIAAMFSTRTLLFFGFSRSGLERFLTSLPAQLESTGRSHFAIVPTEEGTDLYQTYLGQRYGLSLVGYRPSADYHELVIAAEALTARVPEQSGLASGTDTRMSLNSSQLTHLTLRSVGIFRELKVEFTPRWTLLFGNNGGGKSTILRAVALALAGNDPRAAPAARRLLRCGEDAGTIELGIGNSRIVTNLVRDGRTVLVKSPQTTALQAGQLLVLAFPALRGVNTSQVRGPTKMAAANPSVDDVAPLLEGVIDNRLDNLQQWVVNTALRAENDPNGREASMLKTFESLINEMVPSGGLAFARVDKQTWQVILKASYGEVPFDGVSQGMSSILNWIGVLLERLYDVYPRSPKPEEESAIVLIDEIGAHLHPEWQRRLVALTREHFPNVQIIASSHSPLLAGAVEHGELRVVAPNEDTGEIEARMPPENVSGQKAEDILMSSVFSLETTRSVEAEQTIQRYFELYQKGSLSGAEQSELESLAKRLRELNYGPTVAEHLQMKQARTRLDADLANVSAATAQMLQSRLAAGASSERREDSPPTEGQT